MMHNKKLISICARIRRETNNLRLFLEQHPHPEDVERVVATAMVVDECMAGLLDVQQRATIRLADLLGVDGVEYRRRVEAQYNVVIDAS